MACLVDGTSGQICNNNTQKNEAKKKGQVEDEKQQRKIKVLCEADHQPGQKNLEEGLEERETPSFLCLGSVKSDSFKMIVPVLLVASVFALVSGAPGKLPATFPKCKKNDPNIDECLKNAIQVTFPQLSPGLQSLGVFPLDPLKITALDIAQGSGPVAIDLKFRDLLIRGLKNVKIDSVKSDLDNYQIEVTAHLDEPLKLDGQYEVKGSVLVLPLVGNGQAHLSLDNLKASIKLHGKELKKDGRSYMQLDHFEVQYDTSKLHMHFENLFSQDKALADNMNTFLNENWQEIHKELKPAIKEAFGAAFKEIASRIMNRVPYDDIFPLN